MNKIITKSDYYEIYILYTCIVVNTDQDQNKLVCFLNNRKYLV